MVFKIQPEEFAARRKRLLYGLLFSIGLAVIITYQHLHYPEEYNDVLFWSVVGFVVLGNLINYLRHRRYLKRAARHRLEFTEQALTFETGEEQSRLELTDVAAYRVFSRAGGIGHIQLQLANGRGIRLEGYENMTEMATELRRLLPGKEL